MKSASFQRVGQPATPTTMTGTPENGSPASSPRIATRQPYAKYATHATAHSTASGSSGLGAAAATTPAPAARTRASAAASRTRGESGPPGRVAAAGGAVNAA